MILKAFVFRILRPQIYSFRFYREFASAPFQTGTQARRLRRSAGIGQQKMFMSARSNVTAGSGVRLKDYFFSTASILPLNVSAVNGLTM